MSLRRSSRNISLLYSTFYLASDMNYSPLYKISPRGNILTVKFPISKLQNKKIQRWVVREFTCITVPSKNKITHLHLHPFFSLTNCPKLNAGGGSGPVRVIVRYN